MTEKLPVVFAVRSMRSAVAMIFVAACAAPPPRPQTSSAVAPEPVSNDRGDASTPTRTASDDSNGPADASSEANVGASDALDSGTGSAFVPWTDADRCSFPPVSPAEGTTAKQCCNPVPELAVCLETTSTIHHHETGFYTERRLTVARSAEPEPILVLPLDRHHHGSMRFKDTASVLLTFRIQKSGLDVSLRSDSGCRATCVSKGNCKGEEKRVAELCESVGTYGWDGRRLVRVSTEQN